MARSKEFDKDAALDAAMHVFWGKGYAATSLEDLLAAMKIGRQSLYDTFGGKRELFELSLARYTAQSADTRKCLETSISPRAAIETVFEAVLDESVAQQRRGCLGIASTFELAPSDPAIQKKLAADQKRLEQSFHVALERAKKLGEISSAKDSRALARFLVGAFMGLRVAATNDPHGALLKDLVRITLQALE